MQQLKKQQSHVQPASLPRMLVLKHHYLHGNGARHHGKESMWTLQGHSLEKMFLVAVDAHSKWPEVLTMTSTTTTKTIEALCDMFSRYGIPRQIVSVNGPQFTSAEFDRFINTNGIKHMCVAPYHPASNGLAERMVQTLEKSLHASHVAGTPLAKSLATFLFKYRTTPHTTTGVSPCSLIMGFSMKK